MTYVMSDIHGNMNRFRSVMSQIDLKSDDKLFILGDVIDRFPDGIEILRNYVMEKPNVQMLLGNHELMLYKSLCRCDYENDEEVVKQTSAIKTWYRNGGYITHEAYSLLSKREKDEILDYINELPLNIDIEVNNKKYLLVHGAPAIYYHTHNRDGYKNEKEFCTWYRWNADNPAPRGYTMIFGHTPTNWYNKDFDKKEPLKVYFGKNMIGIDCGAFYDYNSGGLKGRLSCIRLDDMKVFYSEENY